MDTLELFKQKQRQIRATNENQKKQNDSLIEDLQPIADHLQAELSTSNNVVTLSLGAKFYTIHPYTDGTVIRTFLYENPNKPYSRKKLEPEDDTLENFLYILAKDTL